MDMQTFSLSSCKPNLKKIIEYVVIQIKIKFPKHKTLTSNIHPQNNLEIITCMH